MRPLVPRPFALVRIYLFRKARVTLLSHPHSSRRYLGADAHRDLERQLSERPPPEGFVVARARETRRALDAGDEARGRRRSLTSVSGGRLRARPSWPGAMERRRHREPVRDRRRDRELRKALEPAGCAGRRRGSISTVRFRLRSTPQTRPTWSRPKAARTCRTSLEVTSARSSSRQSTSSARLTVC